MIWMPRVVLFEEKRREEKEKWETRRLDTPHEYSITEVELKRQTDVNSDYDMDAKGSAV